MIWKLVTAQQKIMEAETRVIQLVIRMHLLEQIILQAIDWHNIPQQDQTRWNALMVRRINIIQSDEWLTDCPHNALMEYRANLMDLMRDYTAMLSDNGVRLDDFSGRYSLLRFTSANFEIDTILQF